MAKYGNNCQICALREQEQEENKEIGKCLGCKDGIIAKRPND
jgi:hypothetical protein